MIDRASGLRRTASAPAALAVPPTRRARSPRANDVTVGTGEPCSPPPEGSLQRDQPPAAPRLDSPQANASQRHRLLSRLPPASSAAADASSSAAQTVPSLQTMRQQWQAWANEPTPSREERSHAVRLLERFVSQPPGGERELELDHLNLSSLPVLPPGIRSLNVSNNQLTTVPALPDSIREIHANHNRLTRLPALPKDLKALFIMNNQLATLPALPEGLESVHANGNQLRRLPALPSTLKTLFVPQNQLTRIPELPPHLLDFSASQNPRLRQLPALPAGLQQCLCDGGSITRFPEVPASLEILDLQDNQIQQLPSALAMQHGVIQLEGNPISDLPTSLFAPPPQTVLGSLAALLESPVTLMDAPSSVEMHLSGENLSVHARLAISTLSADPAYQGPTVYFSMEHRASDAALPAIRPLEHAAAEWHPEPLREAKAAVWAGFAQEPGAAEFSQFLDRLQDTLNFRDPATQDRFDQSVAELLDRMVASPELRQDCFNASLGASASCEDRVTHTFNAMESAKVADDVRQGHFDHDLPGLVGHARSLYRRDAVEGIAREKVASMRLVDPIEVHLAYQVKLNEPLGLGLNAQQMRFYDVSGVSQEDLQVAQARVQTAERQGFTPYLLNNCAPWESAIKRLAPSLHQLMKDAAVDAVSGEAFTQRLNARLSDLGDLQGAARADAERTVGHQVMAELAAQAQWPYVEKFLSERGVRLEATRLLAPAGHAEARP